MTVSNMNTMTRQSPYHKTDKQTNPSIYNIIIYYITRQFIVSYLSGIHNTLLLCTTAKVVCVSTESFNRELYITKAGQSQ